MESGLPFWSEIDYDAYVRKEVNVNPKIIAKAGNPIA
jgi:hypothetical protein